VIAATGQRTPVAPPGTGAGHRWRRAGAAFLLAATLVAGCADDPPEPDPETPAELLARSKATLDATSALRVRVAGEGLPTEGTVLVGATGTAAHPSSFEGEVRISQSGLAVTVPLISVGGTVWAQLPFTTGYAVVDPADVGVSDPGKLIDPDAGVSQLLTADPDPQVVGEVRIDEEVLQELAVELPGDLVGDLLTIADPDATVAGRFAVAVGSGELRRARLTGPFYAGGGDQTYTLLLDQYGLEADISAPTG
jgi:lipoprotein LprG